MSPRTIVERMLVVNNGRDFAAYGLLPGIDTVEFEVRTDEIVGTRFKVKNTDGSGQPLLGLVALVLKKAVARHLRQMRDAAGRTQPN